MSTFSAAALERIFQESFVRSGEWHDEIGSTNDRGNEIARRGGIETPYLILAQAQTAGRGRGANRWWSSAGALTFTLVFDPQTDLNPGLPMEYWPPVALTAGVALCDVLDQFTPSGATRLKWPNDVLIGGKKAAGILAEIPPAEAGSARRLVLGMGVNVNNSLAGAPPEIQSIASALCDMTGGPLDRTQFLIDWLNRLAYRLCELVENRQSLVERWQCLCALTGRKIELQAGNRLIEGICAGINDDGGLLVDTPAGLEKIYGGVLIRAI